MPTTSESAYPHLAHGQAVMLIQGSACETATRLLTQWHNPLPPIVIWLDVPPQSSIEGGPPSWPSGTQVHTFSGAETEQADAVLTLLRSLEQLGVVWAIAPSAVVGAVRRYLRHERHTQDGHPQTKGYWHVRPALRLTPSKRELGGSSPSHATQHEPADEAPCPQSIEPHQ